MQLLMLVFFWFICLIPKLSCCDLNHDWELISQDKRSEIKDYILNRVLAGALKESQSRLMLTSIRDLYRKDEQSKTLEANLMNFSEGHEKKNNLAPKSNLLYLPKNIAPNDLYDPAVLLKLASEFSLDGFLRVKLIRYSLIEQNFNDKYERNEGLQKKVVYHDVELAYALIGKDGQYKDFKDLNSRIEESQIFLDSQSGSRVIVAFKGWDSREQIWKDETYFLGLDSLNRIGGFLWKISAF